MRFCFIVEQEYRDAIMPWAVAEQLIQWGHHAEALEPHVSITCLSDLLSEGRDLPDAYVLKTVAGGPGLTLLEAAGALGIPTINDWRSIPLVRDKAIAAAVARARGLPMPRTYFVSHPALLTQIPAQEYPLVIKPTNGSSGRGVYRINSPEDLSALWSVLGGSFLLAQSYVENRGFDVKLYIAGGEVYAVAKRSPLHPDASVVEGPWPVTDALREIARAFGECFGLDIYGVDLLETPNGWAAVDVNDFPSFGLIPGAARKIAGCILELTHASRLRRSAPRSGQTHEQDLGEPPRSGGTVRLLPSA